MCWVRLEVLIFSGVVEFSSFSVCLSQYPDPRGLLQPLTLHRSPYSIRCIVNNSNEIQVSNCTAFRRRMTRISNACENMAGFPNPLNPLKIIKKCIPLTGCCGKLVCALERRREKGKLKGKGGVSMGQRWQVMLLPYLLQWLQSASFAYKQWQDR